LQPANLRAASPQVGIAGRQHVRERGGQRRDKNFFPEHAVTKTPKYSLFLNVKSNITDIIGRSVAVAFLPDTLQNRLLTGLNPMEAARPAMCRTGRNGKPH